MVASAKVAHLPTLEEATDDRDENLPAPGQSYLQPTMICPTRVVPPAMRTFAQTVASAKKNLQRYRLKSALLI